MAENNTTVNPETEIVKQNETTTDTNNVLEDFQPLSASEVSAWSISETQKWSVRLSLFFDHS